MVCIWDEVFGGYRFVLWLVVNLFDDVVCNDLGNGVINWLDF